jgi:nucleotide-binding universal stress UspA family protein
MHVAAGIAQQWGASVLALGVAAPFPQNVSAFVSVRQPVALDEQSRRDLLEQVREATKHVPAAESWEKRALIGHPADIINATASGWQATLIVMGLGRHNRVDRLFGSETAVRVIRQSKIPVLAVPPKVRSLPSRALIAMDFTPASVAAAHAAVDLVSDDGTLIVAHACGFAGVKERPGDLVDLYRAGARAKLDAAVAELRRHTTRCVDSVVLEGEPGAALVGYARREHCDLIALGGHEAGLMDRILLGSVRTRVVREAQCAVLIVPPTG